MRGRELHDALHELADNFEEVAVPESGRYVGHPAIADETGVTYLPPAKGTGKLTAAVGVAAGLAAFFIVRGLVD